MNGVIHSFPDDATDTEISAALGAIPEDNAKDAPRASTWSDRLGLNEPTASVLTGLLRGSGAGAVDLVQGAASAITGQLNSKLRSDDAAATALAMPQGARPIPQKPMLPDVAKPQNISGTIGSALPVMAEMALPGGAPKALQVAKDALPSAARAGEKFTRVASAAKDIPIETKEVGDAALRIYQLSERGGSMPKAVRDLLKRVTDPAKAAMNYPESRDFASNISRLSADEMQRLTPVMKREVAQLSAALNKANADAAKLAGKGAEYKEAMREYAKAKQLADAMDVVIKKATRAALPAAGLGGAAYWLGRD